MSNYKVKAAIATIGVRGTDYKCAIEESKGATDNDRVLLSVLHGGIEAEFEDSNGEETTLDLGIGADASYAQIDADGNAAVLASDPIPSSDFDISSGDDEEDDDDEVVTMMMRMMRTTMKMKVMMRMKVMKAAMKAAMRAVMKVVTKAGPTKEELIPNKLCAV